MGEDGEKVYCGDHAGLGASEDQEAHGSTEVCN